MFLQCGEIHAVQKIYKDWKKLVTLVNMQHQVDVTTIIKQWENNYFESQWRLPGVKETQKHENTKVWVIGFIYNLWNS